MKAFVSLLEKGEKTSGNTRPGVEGKNRKYFTVKLELKANLQHRFWSLLLWGNPELYVNKTGDPTSRDA